VPAFLLFFKRKASLKPVVVLTAFALLMSVPLSRPIWTLLQPLQETQFPWRWLVLISMGGSILAAAALPALQELERTKRIAILGTMAISVVFTLSHVVREAVYFPPQRFQTMLTNVRGSASVNYWFPIWARPGVRQMATPVEAADRLVAIIAWQPEQREFSVGAGSTTEARIKTFYYPHWTATSEGKVLTTRPDKDGALLVSLPLHAATVQLDFREPRRTKFSTISSLGGLMMIGMLVLSFKRRQKQ
jgi:uncharacterized membrane protein YfhO